MEKTKIQWTDATVNFWQGCQKVSAGCKYCYMYRDKDKYGQDAKQVLQVSEKYIRGISSTYIFLIFYRDP